MKVGDMVKIKKPTTTCYADKLFLVTDTMMMGDGVKNMHSGLS